MYQISQIRNNYNLEENCVVTEIFALNLSNKDDNGEPTPNREVAIYKKFCQDKTEEEMEKYTAPFSLTALSIAADMSPEDVIKCVGKPFKRCLTRLTGSSVIYNVADMLIKTRLYVEVSLEPGFKNPTFFTFANESPLTIEFLKELQFENMAGYKPFEHNK